MTKTMHELHCKDSGADCEFMARSEDRDELVDVAVRHAKRMHEMDISRKDAAGLVKSA